MEIEELEQRLSEFQQERAKAVAHINALDGAMMEIRYWIERFNEMNENGTEE